LANITRLKTDLANLVEPDFGLLEQLLSLGVLTRRQYDDIRSESRATYRRSEAFLDLLVSEDQCAKFLTALQRTEQEHVVNFITQNGGQKNWSCLRFHSLVTRLYKTARQKIAGIGPVLLKLSFVAECYPFSAEHSNCRLHNGIV